MKTTIKLLSIPVLIALGTGCSKVAETDVPVAEPSAGRLVVHADVAETRTTIAKDGDTYKMSWDGDESAMLVLRRYDTWQCYLYPSNAATLTEGSMSFSFGPLDTGSGTTAYDILYPQSSCLDKNVRDVYVKLPTTQTPKATTVDPAASLLYGRATGPEDYGAYATPPTSLDVTFKHAAAYAKMNLSGIPAGETISSIAVTAEDCNIAGEIIYHAHSGSIDYTRTSESTITLDGSNLTADPAGFDVWFACKPFTLEAGKTFTIVTTTSAGVHTSVLLAKVNIVFTAGVVTSFPAAADMYSVMFDTQGGSVVAPTAVEKGQKVSEPSAPTKAVDLVQGLYPGDIDPDACYATFGGWYTDPECTVPYDFDTPVTASFTLYAKWTVPEQINPDDIKWINQGFDYAKKNAGTYTFVLTSNASSGAVLTLNNASSTIVVAGKGSERTISSTVNWQAAIRAQSGTVILANNITVTNTTGPAAMLADGGNIIMRAGSKVKNCSVFPTDSYSDVRGVVYINNASSTFTLDGGEITNNSMTGVSNDYLAATVCANNGNIVINSGSITNNTVTRASGLASVGGAISLPYRNDGAVLRKTGGVISGNSVVDDSKANSRIGQQIISYTITGTRHYYTIDDAIGEGVTFDAIDYSSPIWTLVEPI